jgi:hypothetical protein
VKHGKALLGLVGLVLVGLGVVTMVFASAAVGVVFLIVGVVVLVLAVHEWDEFTAELKDLKLSVSRQQPTSSATFEPARAPELEVVSIEERGGNSKSIDFTAEVTNRGTKSCRARVEADVDGWPMQCTPETLDLGADAGVQRSSVYVGRPTMGTLVPEFNNAATLYGRRLTVRISTKGESAERTWREHVYVDDENADRAAIQRRVWREGADLYPEPMVVGMHRTRLCRGCDEVTRQTLMHHSTGGAGQSIARVWRCLTCGAEPA